MLMKGLIICERPGKVAETDWVGFLPSDVMKKKSETRTKFRYFDSIISDPS